MNYVGMFRTQNPTTGALQDADAPPTASLYRNGALDEAAVLTIAKVATGTYKVTGEFVLGTDRCCVLADATVASVAGGDVIDDLSLAADVAQVRSEIQGAKAGLTPQAVGLRTMADATHVTDATNAAAVDVACPPATTHVFVSSTGAFRFKRSAGAEATDTYMAAGAYLLDMQCPGVAGVFSARVVPAEATEVHVTPMGP